MATFGITPNRAEIGYGYIQREYKIDEIEGAYNIKRFVEKPEKKEAEQYLADGGYDWNSGMFLFSIKQLIAQIEHLQPNIISACCESLEKAKEDLDFLRLDAGSFAKSPSISIDYALMEKTDKAAVIPVEIGWSDIGSFAALWELSDKDENGNVAHGDVQLIDSQNNYVHSHLLTGLVGVDDLIIALTDDALLVAHRDKVQNVKQLVAQLKGRAEIINHRKVYRPWGYYDSLYNGERTQVKELHIKPGAKLSLQKHHHRAEHWVVISGTALVTRDDEQFEVAANESIFVPRGSVHRLENPGKVALKVIEVQSGEYLGEDDIVRIEDDFGRIEPLEAKK